MIAALAALLSLPSFAQGTDNELESSFGGRASVGADWKISKGFHLSGEAEFRAYDSSMESARASLALSYKLNPWLKASAGYVFIDKNKKDGSTTIRHRIYGDLTGSLKAGDWRFSLRERLLMTHKDVGNHYQTTPNLVELKSRFKVSWKGLSHVTPYALFELRTVLNDPALSATWSGSEYSDYQFLGYKDSYINRYRGGLGVEWKLDKHNSLDFYGLMDYCRDKDIDTDSAGETLKSLTYDRKLRGIIGVGYVYSF